MQKKQVLCFILLILCVRTSASAKPAASANASSAQAVRSFPTLTSAPPTFTLTDFGAVGDGVTDDGPALQAALDAIGEAGGGTLFVPAGRYAIVTGVQKDFAGLAADVAIVGVESLTPVPPPTANGSELTAGLGLLSEFAPRTGDQVIAINISGLESFLLQDISFIGTPAVSTDAFITLALTDVWEATIKHSEFYGLSSLIPGGSILQIVRSHFNLKQTVFLGCTGNSGVYGSVVENIEWKGISVSDSIFADYGQRAELYGKLGIGAPFSWISIGNAQTPQNDSPRREAVIRNVFLDEGAISGLSSVPYHFLPPSAPIDLVYVSGLFMNVSNLGTSGNYFYAPRRVLIENSHYGWSHNADAAINILGVANAILDRVECVEDANRILADADTAKLTVIDSVYTSLVSQAVDTKVITTANPDDDPVQYVRQQFTTLLGHEPDAAAHFYWSDRLLQCGENAACLSGQRAALMAYLATVPAPDFSISGTVTDENGTVMPGVLMTLGGSQTVTTQTGPDGKYVFAKLPTSGVYTVAPSHINYTFALPLQTITTPNGNRTVNFNATLKRFAVSVQVNNAAGSGISGVAVALSGSQQALGTTNSSGRVTFTALPAGGNFTITATKQNYTFSPTSAPTGELHSDKTVTFAGALVSYTLSGRVTLDGHGLAATVTLSGSQAATTTTDAAGNYSFTVLAAGNYTLTPTKTNYVFSPTSLTFNDLSGNKVADFNATLKRFVVNVRVNDATGNGIPGVAVALSGPYQASGTTNSTGMATFSGVPAGGNYTLTPTKQNYSFSPASAPTGELQSDQTVTFVGALVTYTISGRLTADRDGLAEATVKLGGSQSAVTTTDADGNYSFTVLAEGSYTLEPKKRNYAFSPASLTFNNLSGNQLADFEGTLKEFDFSSASYTADEDSRTLTVTVDRQGDTSEEAEVTYQANDGSAEQRSDVIPVIGKLTFAPGESSKSFNILIINDTHVEGDESLTLELNNPIGGAPGENSSATFTIVDNDTSETSENPIDGARFFVRQQYRDFLNRQADAEGLDFWSNQIASCGTNADCIADRRMNVSAAFFLSIEFQETGFLVYRLYQAAYDQPPLHIEEFLLDTRTIGQDVIVNTAGWQDQLEANKIALIESFVGRARFSDAYPLELTPTEFVNRLNVTSGATLSGNEFAAAVAEFAGAANSEDIPARGRVLRRVAESQGFTGRQLNPAFVLMQYFGYLQRNPSDPPNTNLDGYNFWLQKLEEFGGDFRRAEMVKAFLVSGEYRGRFGHP